MPILYTQDSPVMGIWKITETWQEMIESFQDNENYLRFVCKMQSDKRKQEWLAIRLLLKHLLGPEVYIDYQGNGVPLLRNSEYYISISHTKGFAAVILSNSENPGIDIELHSGRAWRLRDKFLGVYELEMFVPMHDLQRNNLQTGSNKTKTCKNKKADEKKLISEKIHADDGIFSEQTTLATVCWCAKETAFKSLQQAEVDFINHLHILPFELSDKGIFSIKETKTPLQQIFIINYQITEDFIITWKE